MKITFLPTTNLSEVTKTHTLVTGRKRTADYYKHYELYDSFKESFRGVLIKQNEKVVGYFTYWVFHIDGDPEKYTADIFLTDTTLVDTVLEEVLLELKKTPCKKLIMYCTEKSNWVKDAIEKLGDVHVLTHVESEYDLINNLIAPSKLPPDYQIKSFRELENDMGSAIFEFIFPMFQKIVYDIPGCEEQAKNLTPEKLQVAWSGDFFLEDASLLILHKGTPVAVHNIVSRVNNQVEAGMTGVLREHRRKGLMSALKLYGMKWAKKSGYHKFTSSNEKDNPMLLLNYSLGFVKLVESYALTLSIPR